MMRKREFIRYAVACAAVIFWLGATPVGEVLPYQLAGDVSDSYRLLTTTYYSPVDGRALLAAASDALSDAARKRGVVFNPPALTLQGDPDATTAELDDAIATAARASNAQPSYFAYAAIDAMAKAVNDRYTQFFTPEQYKAFNNALDPERIGGIGVMIAPDELTKEIRVTYVVPNTPAERAGLEAGDLLTAVNGVSTQGATVDVVSSKLRGNPGTTVIVSVVRGSYRAALSIERADVQPPTVIYKMLSGGIGYVWVIAFGRATPDEFDAAIARLSEQGAKALVLDLRNDGGGYVDSALDISSRFTNKPLVTVEARGQHDRTYRADANPSISLPVTILVNQYTASASEITAGALQDDGVALLVGAKTYGKGVMQTLTPLPDGAAIKITTAHYLTPNHRDINLRGIVPDLNVDENHDARFGDVERDAQLRAAMTLLQKKIATKA